MSSATPQYVPPNSGAPWYTYPPYLEAIGDGQSLALPFHTPVTAAFPGVVTRATTGQTGVQVDVARPDGTSYSYVHLDTLDPAIKPGATVAAGQFVGLSGGENPGYPGAVNPATPQYSTGPHIDFDIWQGQAWASQPLPDTARSALASLSQLGLPAWSSGSGGYQTLSTPGAGSNQGPGVLNPNLPYPNVFGAITDPLSAFQAIGAFLTGLLPWVANPLRIAKFVGGLSLIVVSLVVTFRGEIAQAGASYVTASTGVPIATRGKGARGAVSNTIQTAGNVAAFGARARQKEAERQQKAYSAARAAEDVRATREETTRRLNYEDSLRRANARTVKLRGQETDAHAANVRTTRKLIPDVPSAPAPAPAPAPRAPKAGSLGQLFKVTPGGLVPAKPGTAFNETPESPIKSGPGGFGNYLSNDALIDALNAEQPRGMPVGKGRTQPGVELKELTQPLKGTRARLRPRTKKEQMADIEANKAILGVPGADEDVGFSRAEIARQNRNWLRKWARRLKRTRPEGI